MKTFSNFFYLAAKFKIFWLLLKALDFIRFKVGNVHFSLTNKLKEYERAGKNLKDLFSITINDILLGMVIIISIYYIPYFLFGLDFRVKEQIASSYVEILSVIAGICGVIIGLFYAAIVSLGASAYSKMPAEAKELLQKEPIGNVFIRLLSYLTFFCLFLLVLNFFKFEESFISIQFVLILTGVSLFGMVKLGYRLFYFTDPTLLAGSALDLLADTIKLSKVGSYNSENRHFQAYYNRRASVALRTFDQLAKIAKDEVHLSTESFLSLCEQSTRLLIFYISQKKLIPSGSYFHSLKLSHKKWYEISNISIDSYDVMGFLPPDEIRDHLWIERKILNISIECIGLNLANRNFEIAEQGIRNLLPVTKLLVRNYESDFVIEYLTKLDILLLEFNDFKSIKENANYEDIMRVFDNLGYLKTNLLIALLEDYEQFDVEKIKEQISKISWGKDVSIYKAALPSFTHEIAFFLNKTISYENSIEGSRITPNWYIHTLYFQKYAEMYLKSYSVIFDYITKDIEHLKKSSIYKSSSTNKWADLLICAYLDRMLEQKNKLEIVSLKFKEIWKILVPFNIIEGLEWPNFTEDLNSSLLEEWKVNLTDQLSLFGARFNLHDYSVDFPDYGGKFLHFVGNYLLEHLMRKSVLSKSTYETFHLNSFMMFDKLRSFDQTTPQWKLEGKMQVAVAPVVDLISLSGFIILLSKYYSDPTIEDTVVNCWNNYLKEKLEDKIKKLEAIVSYPDQIFMSIPHRSFHRGKWEQAILNFLRDNIEIKEDWYVPNGAFGYQEKLIIKHDSPLVRVYLKLANRLLHGYLDGENIFIDFYLLEKAKEIDGYSPQFCRKQGELVEKVNREEVAASTAKKASEENE